MRGCGTFGQLKSGKSPSFAVVIPMYNEEKGAQRCVDTVIKEIRKFASAVLIVVNDGSRDATGSILTDVQLRYPDMVFVSRRENDGYGSALRAGVEEAARRGLDYAIFMDSDLTNDPRDIPKFAAKMCEGYDVIKASRFISGGGMNGIGRKRSMFSRWANIIARVLTRTGLHDCTNGFRAVRVPLLMQMTLRERGFPIIMEELYHCKRMKATFAEVPTLLSTRSGDQRPTSFVYNWKTFHRYLKYCILCLRNP